MKSALLTAAVVVLLVAAFMRFREPPSKMTATITQSILIKDVVPFGVNLGSWTFWGAEQLMSNVIKNPGFEGIVDAAIVLPVHSGDGSFDDGPAWLARPDGFWEGAHYSIRTGSTAGASGIIAHSAAKSLFGLPSFTVEGNGPMPDPAEAVAVQKVREDALPTQWWFSKDPSNVFSPERKQVRPGSPGTRSLRISAGSYNPADLASYVDAIGDRAGKLLPFRGRWTVSFWAKLDRGHASLRVVLGREGSKPVLVNSPALSSAWKQFQLPFDGGGDDGPPGLVSLRFQVSGNPAGDVLLDDVDLRRDSDAGFPFRQEVVSTLQTLHPSYLRDWEGQLGDTLANRIASAFGRKSYRYRPPGDETQSDFGYGLGDFISLARKLDAAPWIIVPTVFTDDECAGLGDWLSSPGRLDPNREVLVEFGNENWNELFRPAGIADPVVHGHAADRCLAAVRGHARGLRLKTAINAQFANAERVVAYGNESHEADIVAVAPYFGLSMAKGLSLAKRNLVLFESRNAPMNRMASDVMGIGKDIAVYEVNLHTVSGTASEAERAPVVAGIASGTALARTLLNALAHGMKRQCVYSFTGFDAGLETAKGHAPLWGIVRDVTAPDRFRPTGLALKMLNDTVGGNMMKVEERGPADVSVYAFEAKGRVSVVVVSGSAEVRQISLKYPAGAALGGRLRVSSLAALSPTSSNESVREVTVRTSELLPQEQSTTFVMEPWSMTIVQPGER